MYRREVMRGWQEGESLPAGSEKASAGGKNLENEVWVVHEKWRPNRTKKSTYLSKPVSQPFCHNVCGSRLDQNLQKRVPEPVD